MRDPAAHPPPARDDSAVLVVVGGLTNLALHEAGVAHPNALTGVLLALGYLVGTAWLRRATRQDLATTGPLLEPWPPR